MLHNKLILPLVCCSFLLCSCGLGIEISRDDFTARIDKISPVSNGNVSVNGSLSSKNADVESKIVFDYVFTFEDGAYKTNKIDSVSSTLIDYFGVRILSDFEKTNDNETAKFYDKEAEGFAIYFETGSDDEQISSFSAKYEYQYDVEGRYTHVKEYETFINQGLTYTTLLEVSFNWVK